MSENNPYSPPTSEIDEPLDELGMLSEPHKVPGSHGWRWISEGYSYFRKDPLAWVLTMIVFMLITVGLSFIPFVSLVINILMPVFIGGIMLGCQALDKGKNIQISHLFACFQTNAGKLIGLGGLYLGSTIVIGIITAIVIMVSGGMEAFVAASNGEPRQLESFGVEMISAVAVALLLFVPLMMGFWFAPPLIALHNLPLFQAIQISYHGCKRNMMPFFIYGLIALLFSAIAALPFFIGYLILAPVLMASLYAAYKDIFLVEQ